MKILIAYDGTLHAKKALTYGLRKVKAQGGEVLVLQVFDRQLFIDYDAGPAATELARAEASRMYQEGRKLLQDQDGGIETRMDFEEGDAAALIRKYAADEQIDLVLLPAKLRKLTAALSRPALVIPGTVLVPVDNTESAYQNRETIVEEAVSTGSRVYLAGIVPVHIYNRDEEEELEQVKAATLQEIRRIADYLRTKNIAAGKELRFGYPDEEILKCAAAQSASLILLPSGGAIPSELSKAASIILEESKQIEWPVALFPQPGEI